MSEVLGALVAMLVGAALVLAVPITIMILWSRTRSLQSRIDGLEDDLRNLRLRDTRNTPEAAQPGPVASAPARVPEAAPEAPLAPGAALALRAPEAPDAPLAPLAPRAPVAPLAPRAPRAPEAPLASEAPRAPELPRAPEPESLETMIGSRWLLYIGVIAIVVGVSYFEKLAIDRGWVSPMARVIQGAVVGLALMFAGAKFVKRGYEGYGQIIMGGGGAILYLSTYAAFNFYALIERPVAFALMVAITALIAWLADRHRSQGLAIFAVGGGFVTPFLLPGSTDAQITLFTYDAILIAGTAVLSHRRDWPFLHLVSYVLTVVTVLGWANDFYATEKYLRTEVYLTIYFGMFMYIGRECRRKASDAAQVVGLLLQTAPLLYYIASLVVLAPHDVSLLVWLVAVMLAGAVVFSRARPVEGFLTWTAVAAPLVMWCVVSGRNMRQEGFITLAAVYVIALVTELEATMFRDEPREVGAIDIAWVHLNPLVMYAGAYLLISPVSLVSAGYFAAAFAAWQGILAGALWRRRPELAVHFLAVGFTLTAVAIALIFNGTAITAGWAAEGTAVIVLAQRQRLAWLRIAGAILFVIAVAQTLAILASPPPAVYQVLLNQRAACASLVIALCYALAWQDRSDPEIPQREVGMAAALLTAQLVTLVLLTSEINAYWAIRNGHLEKELTLSIAWGLYATALVVIGLQRDYAPIRYFAIVVLAITIAKVFFLDMAELDRIYRIGSVIVLGVLLLVTSFLYNRSGKAIDDRNGRL